MNQRKRSVGKRGLTLRYQIDARHLPEIVPIILQAQNAVVMKGIIGKKIGMTSIFDPAGKQTACTIIEAGPCVVTQVKTQENDGYSALQLSFGDRN